MATAELPVHPSALPNDAAPDRLRLRPEPDGSVSVDPERAGWRYLSFRVERLHAGSEMRIGRPGHEAVVVNLLGSALGLSVDDGPSSMLAGRESVFDGPPWLAYLPAGRPATVRSLADPGASTLVAIAAAPGRPG